MTYLVEYCDAATSLGVINSVLEEVVDTSVEAVAKLQLGISARILSYVEFG